MSDNNKNPDNNTCAGFDCRCVHCDIEAERMEWLHEQSVAALELTADEVGVQGFDDPDFEPVRS